MPSTRSRHAPPSSRLFAASLLCAVLMAGCGRTATAPAAGPLTPAARPAAQSKGGTTLLRVERAAPTASKPSASAMRARPDRGGKVKARTLSIALQARLRQDLDPQQVVTIATMALAGMNGAQSYESGYDSGIVALKQIDAQLGGKNMAARFGVRASGAAGSYQTAYKQVAATLAFLRDGTAPSGRPLLELAIRLHDGTCAATFEDGAKAGYEILQTLTDMHPDAHVRNTTRIAYQAAQAASTWDDAYQVVDAALTTLRDEAQ